MGLFTYVLRNHAVDTVTSATPDNSFTGFPGDNLLTFPIAQPWRSNNDLDPHVIYDLGIPQNIDFAAALNHNVSLTGSITVERSNTASGPWVLFGVMKQNPWIGKVSWFLREAGTQYRRYWRFSMEDITNTAGYLQAGLFVLGRSETTPWPIDRPYQVTRGISQRSNNSEEESPIIGATLSERSRLTVAFVGMSQSELDATESALATFGLRKNPVAILPDGLDGNEMYYGRMEAAQIVDHHTEGRDITGLSFLTDPFGVEA